MNLRKNKKILSKLKILDWPVTRVDVLRKAKSYKGPGLCLAIQQALLYYGLYPVRWSLSKTFPLFTRENAKRFGGDPSRLYWWPIDEWNTGRMDFLNWLIEQYKNDNTDLRKL